MAREMTKKTRRFSLEESDAIEENERILESGSQQRKENRENKGSGEAAASAAPAPSSDIPATDKPTASTTTETEIPTNVANQRQEDRERHHYLRADGILRAHCPNENAHGCTNQGFGVTGSDRVLG